MKKIPLRAVPNQTLTCTLGKKLFDITVQLGASGGTLLSVTVDGVVLFSSLLSVRGAQMMIAPFAAQYGNLVWICADGDSYPAYTKFGTTHGLYWWPL